MKRTYIAPQLKVRSLEPFMLDFSSTEGGEQYGKEMDFNYSNVPGSGSSFMTTDLPQATNVWEEEETEANYEVVME